MGVVKGSAYGSGLLPVVEVLLEEGVQQLSVATVAEGVYLRKHNIHVPITVLGMSVTVTAVNNSVIIILCLNMRG